MFMHIIMFSLNRFRDAVCSIIMLFFFLARVKLYIIFIKFMHNLIFCHEGVVKR